MTRARGTAPASRRSSPSTRGPARACVPRRGAPDAQVGPAECGLDLLLPYRDAPIAVTASGAPAWIRDGVLLGVDAASQVAELDRGAVTNLRADGDVVRWNQIRDMGIHYDGTLVWKDGTGGQRYRDVRRRKTTGCAPHRKEVVTLSTPGVLLTADAATRSAHAACMRDTGVKLGIYLTTSATEARPAASTATG